METNYKNNTKRMIFAALVIVSFMLIQTTVPLVGTVQAADGDTIAFVLNDTQKQMTAANLTGSLVLSVTLFNEEEALLHNFSADPLLFVASVNGVTVDHINATMSMNTTVVTYDLPPGEEIGTPADANITAYWTYGGEQNLRNMITYMDNTYYGNSTPVDPPLNPETEPETEPETTLKAESDSDQEKTDAIAIVLNDSQKQISLINATGGVPFNLSVFNQTEAEQHNFSTDPIIFLASVNNATVDHINATADKNATFVVYDLPPGNTFGTPADQNITSYWSYGGDENIKNMLIYMDNLYFGNTTEVDPPRQMNGTGPKIVMIIGGESYVPMYSEAGKKSTADVTVYASKCLPADLNLTGYDLIFMEMFGAGIDIIEPAVNNATALGIPVAVIHGGTYEYLGTVDMSNHAVVEEYWDYSGPENARRLINYLSAGFCSANVTVEEPVVTPLEGIYHPDGGLFDDLDEYMAWYATNSTYDPSKPTIGVVFYESHYKSGDLRGDYAVFREFEAREANIIPVFLNYKNPDIIERFFVKDGNPIIDAIVNIRCFRFYGRAPDRGIELLKTYNLPIINALTDYSKTPEEWINGTDGLTASKVGYTIAMPELDGQTDFIWIAGRGIDPETEAIGFRPITPVDEQVSWLVDRTLALAELRHKANTEKKVAIIYYNHGGGRNNLGASYLDIVPSLSNLLDEMKTEGYSINGEVPDQDELLDLMLLQGRNVGTWAPEELTRMVEDGDVTLIPSSQYIEWFHELPDKKQQEVIEMWGEPPGEIMVYNNGGTQYLVIPKVSFGNVILTPQPTRGWLQDSEVLYHDKDLPPHHQYIASYFWLRNEFDADALIHFGRHGTHEWLPGKERGLSATDCWPAILLGDCPNIYPYIMDGVGEGTQAKRRGNAVIVDHLTPPIVTAGLYGNYSLMHEKIHNYETVVNGSVKEQYRISITELYRGMGMESTLGHSAEDLEDMSEAEFAAFISGDLHQYLHRLADEFIPYGLHILGETPQGNELVSLIQAMLGEEFEEHVGLLYPEPHDLSPAHGNCTVLEALLSEVILNGTGPETAEETVLGAGKTSADVTADLNTAINYKNELTACIIEIPRIINALNGGYIPPDTGGDPVRNPDALPTGNNFHSFDSRIMPTQEAWEVGVQMAKEMIDHYRAGHDGAYPNKVAFVLWACEAMRHEGVTESEALYLLGVKPVWSRGKVKGVELIPSAELGRPRIDVLFTVSGLYRDTYPDKIELLDKAVRLAAGVEEYPNYVRENSEALYNVMLEKGYDEETAKSLSMARIFSAAPGAYGTGMSSAIGSSSTWDDTSKLVDLYLNKMCYVYGSDGWGEPNRDLFRENLGKVEAAVHSRSSNIYGVLDNDDCFQYFGALSLAIRTISGQNPEMYITDLRSVDNPRTTTLSEFIMTELNARYFNPKWIEGMMEHGYAGARYMDKKFLENLWGWTVTNPDLISDEIWDRVFDVYMNDKYDLGLDEFFNSASPYAKQSMIARMLETARKGYWNPDQSVIEKLVREYKESVKVNGVTCCHHTCGNILLDEYIQSNYKEEVKADTRVYNTGDAGDTIPSEMINKTVQEEGSLQNTSVSSGYDVQSLQPLSDQPEVSDESSQSENGETLQGRVMKEVNQSTSLSDMMTGTPIVPIALVISIIGVISYGFWFRKK